MRTQEPSTPIALWLVDQCKRKLDPKTGKPITWRQASIGAGLDHDVIARTVHGSIPSTATCHKLAAFFGAPPALLLRLAGHIRSVKEFDPIYQADPELYDLLEDITTYPLEDQQNAFNLIKTALKLGMKKK